jgi:hypothetical protein
MVSTLRGKATNIASRGSRAQSIPGLTVSDIANTWMCGCSPSRDRKLGIGRAPTDHGQKCMGDSKSWSKTLGWSRGENSGAEETVHGQLPDLQLFQSYGVQTFSSDFFCIFLCKPGQLIRYSDRLHARRSRDQGSIPDRGKRFFSFPQRPDRLWGLPSLLSNGYLSSFPGRKVTGEWSWPTQLHLVPRLRMDGAIPSLPHTSSWRCA